MIELNGKPWEGSETNTAENVAGQAERLAGEAKAALGDKPGAFTITVGDATVIVTVGKPEPTNGGADEKSDATTSPEPKPAKAARKKAAKGGTGEDAETTSATTADE